MPRRNNVPKRRATIRRVRQGASPTRKSAAAILALIEEVNEAGQHTRPRSEPPESAGGRRDQRTQ
jgi:hypothetical protein